jgi:hypothetical protein
MDVAAAASFSTLSSGSAHSLTTSSFAAPGRVRGDIAPGQDNIAITTVGSAKAILAKAISRQAIRARTARSAAAPAATGLYSNADSHPNFLSCTNSNPDASAKVARISTVASRAAIAARGNASDSVSAPGSVLHKRAVDEGNIAALAVNAACSTITFALSARGQTACPSGSARASTTGNADAYVRADSYFSTQTDGDHNLAGHVAAFSAFSAFSTCAAICKSANAVSPRGRVQLDAAVVCIYAAAGCVNSGEGLAANAAASNGAAAIAAQVAVSSFACGIDADVSANTNGAAAAHRNAHSTFNSAAPPAKAAVSTGSSISRSAFASPARGRVLLDAAVIDRNACALAVETGKRAVFAA